MDHTKGEIKSVRGSGPPILTIEGEAVVIGALLFLLEPHDYAPRQPHAVRVIGIDLTRRTVRLQVVGGKEMLYVADGNGGSTSWIFSTSDNARRNAVACCQKAVKRCEEAADQAIGKLETAKSRLSEMERWEPRESDWPNES